MGLTAHLRNQVARQRSYPLFLYKEGFMLRPIDRPAKALITQISRAKTPNWGKIWVVTGLLLAFLAGSAWAFTTEASYYTVKSCLAESGQATMANGKALNDNEYTFASWDYRFGQRVKITNLRNNRSIVAVCTDHGPARRLYRKGRKIDLSKKSFEALAPLTQGIIQVEVIKLDN
jgi:rare lipoprotein A